MAVTPSELFALALKRHRQPWNWTLHLVSLPGFALTLFFHSYLMFATSLILFGAGFFELGLPAMPQGRWHGFVHEMVEWEKNWIAAPWNWRKIYRLLFVILVATFAIWILWIQEIAGTLLLIGFGYLLKVVRENKQGGVDL